MFQIGSLKELYIRESFMQNTKIMLRVYSDSNPKLDFYGLSGYKIQEYNAAVVKCGNGSRVSYGACGSIPLVDYKTGELSKEWERIK